MVRNTSIYLAIVSGLLLAPFADAAAPLAEMGEAVVTEAPTAKAMGAATFATGDQPGPTLIALSAPARSELLALKSSREAGNRMGQALQIGFGRDVPNPRINLSKLGWKRLADGRMATRFEISSDTAVALRAAFSLKSLHRSANPAAVTLRFGGSDGRVFEQNGREFSGRDAGWSPVVIGEKASVEVVLAKGQRPQYFNLSMPQVSHLDTSPIASETQLASIAKIGESQPCERDIVCRVNPTAGFLSAEKAVARMTFVKSGRSYLCTGTLLNNNYSPKKRLFWSAAHCISSQTVADTLQTYWFYKATTCGGTTQAPGMVTLSGGAFIRHANTTRDTLLLELKTAPPVGATYASWTSAAITTTGAAIEGIHHPAGDAKMYSLGTITGVNLSVGGYSPLNRVQWNTGVTEGGSSGSALFTINSSGTYQLRGGLYGGSSYCTAPTSPDYYSRFSDVYASIASYFNP